MDEVYVPLVLVLASFYNKEVKTEIQILLTHTTFLKTWILKNLHCQRGENEKKEKKKNN